jgi:hypothetical protein
MYCDDDMLMLSGIQHFRFYHLNRNKTHSVETLGRITSYDVNSAIIL